MATFIDIDDPADPRLADYVSLRDVNLRKSLEAEHGLFIAEGAKVIRRACEAGYPPRSFLLAPRWIDGLRDLFDGLDVEVFVVSETLAEQVTGFHVHRGALASMCRQTRWSAADLMAARRLVVCEDIVDHTNVGAIIRCAAGIGWDGVLLAPRAADPLYRRAIKTSMGTVFQLPWARLEDWAGGLDELRDHGFTVAAMALSGDSLSLDEFSADLRQNPRKVALLMGTEGTGLSAHWISQADVVVRIPMAGGVDSLNVAAAAAVACYELREVTRVSLSE
ncbi:RNA methyltransferase [Cutibacterium acnes]|uniref:rRNA methyltransferase n=1 Tax=Cutibacterium acnes TaxID=1747 RepID=A0AA44U3Y7_CUTAC|nr:RNA methyltransferase [Cutibacterium acnes]OFP51224.1 rRNA methyltransferase [Propionibacterium sp. HMSC067A01]OFQ64569.1 rRNA methyltransferase [Propionibacterium sp. HMSC075A12]EFS87605.1 RNA methyltransferase, TrmH family [Cutibacterium acnes HL001PA1]EFT10311.1 RNA methyltransferase, TrmH family [Cutibacterium acnes HL082PA2]EFT67078.1 RNA methyltransferase, TrmH family [Cutibacterium acnes HL060PA1]